MKRIYNLYKRDGIFEIFDRLLCKIKSEFIRRRFGYGKGFFLGSDTVWLTKGMGTVGEGFRTGKRCKFELILSYGSMGFEPSLSIGSNVTMNDDVHIGCAGKIILGNNILMASKIYISDHNHGSYATEDKDIFLSPKDRSLSVKEVIIEDDVWIGEMVSILPGVKIGKGCVIGANSVVTKDIPEYSIAAGTPAKVIKTFSR